VALVVDAEFLGGTGVAPFAQRLERGGHGLGDALDMGSEAQRGIELVLERGRVDDVGELAGALLPGAEVQLGADAVAVDAHVVDGGAGVLGQAFPDAQPAEQRDRRGIQRVGPDVGGGPRGGGPGQQRHAQAAGAQRQRQAAADAATAANQDVELFHGPGL